MYAIFCSCMRYSASTPLPRIHFPTWFQDSVVITSPIPVLMFDSWQLSSHTSTLTPSSAHLAKLIRKHRHMFLWPWQGVQSMQAPACIRTGIMPSPLPNYDKNHPASTPCSFKLSLNPLCSLPRKPHFVSPKLFTPSYLHGYHPPWYLNQILGGKSISFLQVDREVEKEWDITWSCMKKGCIFSYTVHFWQIC